MRYLKSFNESYDRFDIYEYFSDISDEVDDFKIYNYFPGGQIPYEEEGLTAVTICDTIKKYKNPILWDFMKIITEKKNIISRTLGNPMGMVSDFKVDEDARKSVMGGLKRTKLIQWIESSSNYTLMDAQISRSTKLVGIATTKVTEYSVTMVFDKTT
jgi:hypothetical protein